MRIELELELAENVTVDQAVQRIVEFCGNLIDDRSRVDVLDVDYQSRSYEIAND